MPEGNYFLKMSGAILLGLATLVIAFIAVILLAPFIIPLIALLFPFLAGAFLITAAVFVVWAMLYVLALIGAVVYYFFRPMQVSREPGKYSLSKVKESGMREKGESGKKKKTGK